MMNLEIQFKSLFYSCIYGVVFCFFFNLLYSLLFKKRKYVKVIASFLFILISFSIYFYILLKINNGVVNSYMLISFLFGFFISNKLTKKIRYKKKIFNN